MKTLLLIAISLFCCTSVKAQEIFKVELGAGDVLWTFTEFVNSSEVNMEPRTVSVSLIETPMEVRYKLEFVPEPLQPAKEEKEDPILYSQMVY
jgi:hypothetical protein